MIDGQRAGYQDESAFHQKFDISETPWLTVPSN